MGSKLKSLTIYTTAKNKHNWFYKVDITCNNIGLIDTSAGKDVPHSAAGSKWDKKKAHLWDKKY